MATPDFDMVFNTLLTRAALLDKMVDGRRDLNAECDYPDTISAAEYRYMYDREGIAERVVGAYPTACWEQDPEILETEESDLTPFEEAWQELEKKHRILHYMERIDELSGIGHFGVLLFGFDDGKNLDEPLDGISETGERPDGGNENGQAITTQRHQLLYVRAFDESLVRISEYETDESNPRFGRPTKYTIKFIDPKSEVGLQQTSPDMTEKTVHWTRCVHIADNRKSSEIYGTPRMQGVFNRLLDIRKLCGGSAEMFWRGAFPGFSFEVNPDLADVELDKDAMRDEFYRYANGLQRYLALTGVSAKSLGPQVAPPEAHFMVQVKYIAMALDIPMRILMGTEQAQLAGAQDSDQWEKKVRKRRERYLSPMLIHPIIDHLILAGVLPEPAEPFFIKWPDIAEPTRKERAESAVTLVQAVAAYLEAKADVLIPPMYFLTEILGFETADAEAMLDEALEALEKTEEELSKNETPALGGPPAFGEEPEEEEEFPPKRPFNPDEDEEDPDFIPNENEEATPERRP